MTIRAATYNDSEAIGSVYLQSWKWAFRGVVTDEQLNWVADRGSAGHTRNIYDPRCLSLVSLAADGAVVAFAREGSPASLEGYDCEIASLYVHPEHTRQGHGTGLVRAMAWAFAKRGEASLCIETLRDSRIGRSFYEGIGGRFLKEDRWEDLHTVWYGWSDVGRLSRQI